MIDTKTQDAAKKTNKKENVYKKKFLVDFNPAITNNLLSLETAVSYLNSRIKLNGLTNKLGDKIEVNATDKKEKQKNTVVVAVDSNLQFSKRYIRYLVKKFLKKEGISSFLRVISTGPQGFVVKMFQRNVE